MRIVSRKYQHTPTPCPPPPSPPPPPTHTLVGPQVVHAYHVQEVPAHGRGKAAHECPVLHQRLPGARARNQLVVVEGSHAEQRKVGAGADVDLTRGEGGGGRVKLRGLLLLQLPVTDL